MSNACFYRPYQVESIATTFSPPRPTPDLFNIRLNHGEGKDLQHFLMVHIPPNVQSAFAQGTVRGLHLESLETNGVASRALPGQPRYAVLGVELADGSAMSCAPPVLHTLFKRKLAIAAALCLIGGLMGATPYPWFGGLLAGLGTHFARTAFGIPRRPFWPPRHVE